MPHALQAKFTEGERAALCIIASEVKRTGLCDAFIDEIARRAGVCRTTVQNAVRVAKGLELIKVTERKVPGRKSQTNLIEIVSPEWLVWIKRGPAAQSPTFIGLKAMSTTESKYSKERKICKSRKARKGNARGALGYRRAPQQTRGGVMTEHSASEFPIDKIKIGKRHRQDMGDIDELAQSIKDVGLLHPVVIRVDGVLIAGARRIAACRKLGWKEIPIRVVDLNEVARGEFAENKDRKDFTLSEAVAIARALAPVERKAARKRMSDGGRGGEIPHPSKGRALDKVAGFVGKDRKTIDKATAIVEAAKSDPEKFGKLKEDMDRTGRVDGPHKRLKVIRQSEAIRKELPPWPKRGPYRDHGCRCSVAL